MSLGLCQAIAQRTTDQIASLKGEHEKAVAKLQEEVATLKSSVDAKTEEVNEKNKTLLQVRCLTDILLTPTLTRKITS